MEPCPISDCSNHGMCRGGKCFCNPGFMGDGCETVEQCPSPQGSGTMSCSGHGVCVSGECYCDEAHDGEACETFRKDAKVCYKDCSSHGLCKQGRCFCAQGFAGVGCEIEVGATDTMVKLNAKLVDGGRMSSEEDENNEPRGANSQNLCC